MPKLLFCTVPLLLLSACVPSEGDGSKTQNKPAKVTPKVKTKASSQKPVTRVRPKPQPGSSATLKQRRIQPKGKAEPAADQAPAAVISKPFADFFERSELGPDWRSTSSAWKIDRGKLCGQRARNHPVWLHHRLPVNARIEFKAISYSSDGDIKAEFWGDGSSKATGVSYNNATSYLTIFGGWKNRFHVLARIDEHAKDMPEIRIDPNGTDLRASPVRPNVAYHFKVERNDGKTVRWFVDDIEILNYPDPKPLKGAGHEYFGFNDWEVRVCFDELKITPL